MKWFRLSISCLTWLFLFGISTARGDHLFHREVNTTITMPQQPQPAFHSYFLAEALSGVAFDKPVGFAVEPGQTNRLFVVERMGRIQVITNLSNPTPTLFLDMTSRVYADYQFGFVEGLSSLVFHPGYATNRYFYVTYTSRTNENGVERNYNRLARFETSPTNANMGILNSELPLITQLDEGDGHNINDAHFGPDGYLYVAIGDEGDGRTGGDEFNNGQRIDKDFFSAILRIDVDKRPGSLPPNAHPAASTNYAIPSDNPYLGVSSFNGAAVNPPAVRTEFYAVGFRNVWRMSFDPNSGQMYVGDVGAYDREEINVVTKGGNYGWAFREGTRRGPKENPPPEAILINPVAEIGHGHGTNQGNAIIGGRVYRGQRMPELNGAYVFSDFVSGNIWMLRYDGTNATPFTRIAGKGQIAGFGADPRNGDLLLADHESGLIFRLESSPSSGSNLPGNLAATGVFADTAALTPNAGVVPYEINVPFWSDNAKKRRWFSIPNTNLTMGFSREGDWTFPSSTVWIKHFDLEMETGNPASSRRVETRLLVKNQTGVYGVTYRWGDSASNATLVAEEGMNESFSINDGGTTRTQVWRYPSRSECLSCHTAVSGYALGFTTPQLNRDFNYGIVTNQLFAYSDAGYFNELISDIHSLRAMAHATNSAYSREYRIRSYLAANCAQCHQPGGTGGGFWDARITNPTGEAGIINGVLANHHGDLANRVITPGDTGHSMLHTRIASFGSLRMPPLGTSVLDSEALNLMRAWITNDLPGYQTFAEWQVNFFGSTNAPEAARNADPDLDQNANYLEYLLGRNPLNAADRWRPSLHLSNNVAQISFLQISNRGFEVQSATNLQMPVIWKTVDINENRPFFSVDNRTNTIADTTTNAPSKFYRLRVFEP